MANIISYIKWRGDLNFSERPFCEVDNLVLAELAYVDFDGIVPKAGTGEAITLAEAAKACIEQGKKCISLQQPPSEFLEAVSASVRFRPILLSKHQDILDEETQTEFSALHMDLGDGTTYVAFRGTGDRLVGWREDFSMSFQQMPSQKSAADYLAQTMEERRIYRVGGHSKGGNLAVYASMMCPPEKQAQIREIYSNDGPGFCEELIDLERYQGIRERIVRIVPEFSIIGALFENDPPTKIVPSTAEGLNQHDGFSWQVEGDHFLSVESRSERCLFYNETIDHWIESADLEQRRVFVKDLFDALEKAGTKRFSDVGKGGLDEFETILLSLANSESRTKIVIGKFLRSLAATFRSVRFREVIREKKAVQGALYLCIGLFLAAQPRFAAQGIGFAVGLIALVWLGKMQLECAFSQPEDDDRKRFRLISQMVLMCAVVWLVCRDSLRLRFSNLMIGGFFLFHAYRWLKRATSNEGDPRNRLVDLVFGILAFLFAVVPIIAAGLVLEQYVFGAGVVILLYGAGKVLRAMYENGQKNEQEKKS